MRNTWLPKVRLRAAAPVNGAFKAPTPDEWFRSFVTNTPAVLFALDANGVFTVSEGKGLAALGLKPGEVVGRSVFEVYKDYPELLVGVRRALAGEEFTVVVDVRELAFDTRYSSLRDPVTGCLAGTTGVALDVTQRRKAEAVMEQRITALTRSVDDTSNIHFEDLFNVEDIQKIQDAFAYATGVASIITDVAGRPITRPSNFCRLCSEIIRKSPKGCANCMKSDAVLGRLNAGGPIMQPCLSGGLWDGGTSICVGERHIANWLIGQVLDDSADHERMLAYAREIGVDESQFAAALTEVTRMPREQFRRVCQALFLLADQLSRLALQNVQQARYITERREVEAALREAKHSAEEANRAKDQFLAMVSHELRTPLTPALLAVSQMAASPAVPEELRGELAAVQRHVEMEARLIDDLLDLSRISAGKLALNMGVCDVEAVIEAANRICREELRAKGVRLDTELGATRTKVLGDFGRLQQVLWNLVKNSIKFTPAGGWIRVVTRDEGERVVLEVKDNGWGIEAGALPSIFGIFQQGEAESRRMGGLGIGLTICKAIVEAHKGAIEAASEGLGKGATFRVTLPTTRQQPAAERPREPARQQAEAMRILLVEDHEATASLMARLLRMEGHQVSVAGTVAAAVELAERGEFDLLLSDIGLPDGTGIDVLNQVKRIRPMPAIALSGFGMEQDLERSQEAGFAEHIIKPVDFDRLRAAIGRVGRR